MYIKGSKSVLMIDLLPNLNETKVKYKNKYGGKSSSAIIISRTSVAYSPEGRDT